MRSGMFRAALFSASLLAALPAHAAAYSALYVFGDSLSDNGNIPAASGYRPSAPYADGRFSNGPVAVEYLADNLGLAPSDLHDYAVGGATTGLYNAYLPSSATGILSQVDGYTSTVGMADPNALYVVWGGPDDFASVTNPLALPATISTAVGNLVSAASALHAAGAQHILMPNMVDLGLTPEGQSLSYLLNPVTLNFDSQLAASLPDYVTQFDTFGLLNAVVANPSGYGFSNVTDACISVPTCVNGTLAQQNQYLFWDDAHPTTAAFSVLAGQFSATVAAVPEPADAALLGSGLLVVLAATRSRQRRSGLVARRAMA